MPVVAPPPATHLARIGSIAVWALIVGCADRGVTHPGPDSTKATTAAQGDRVGLLRDKEISASDSYIAVELHTTSITSSGTSGAAPVARSLASATLAAPDYDAMWSSRYVETGYDASGQFRFSAYRDPSANPIAEDPPSLIRSVGNTVTAYDQNGSVMAQWLLDELFSAYGFPGGSFTYASLAGTTYYEFTAGGGIGGPATKDDPYDIVGSGSAGQFITPDLYEIRSIQRVPYHGSGDATGSPAPRLEAVRRYALTRVEVSDSAESHALSDVWLLTSKAMKAIAKRDGHEDTLSTYTTYRYLAVHIHRNKDRARANKLEHDHVAPSARVPGGDLLRRSGRIDANISGESCATGVGTVRTPDPGTPTHVVYQHGFKSDASTWCAMRMEISEDHIVGHDQAHSLTATASIQSQAGDLQNRVLANGAGPHIVIGHSQGGLVARQLGDLRPDLVNAVVTVGTPHLGAYIASAGPNYVAQQLQNAIGRSECLGDLMCQLVEDLKGEILSGLMTWGLEQALPAAGEETYQSPFIEGLNGQTESYQRASIQVDVPLRWSVFRVLGDAKSSRGLLTAEQHLMGRDWAQNASYAYLAGWFLQDAADMLRWFVASSAGDGTECGNLLYQAYWPACNDPDGFSDYFWTASFWLSVANILDFFGSQTTQGLNAIDGTWNTITTRNEGTGRYLTYTGDGFIQYASQVYPAVPGPFLPRRFHVNSLEAHTGETASIVVRRTLIQALEEFGLQRRP